MTIKIEREAVLYVLTQEEPSGSNHATPSKAPSQPYDDDAEIVVYSPKEEAPVLIPLSATSSRSPCLLPYDCSDDDSSLCSTPELVDSDVDSDVSDDDSIFDEVPRARRRVTFAQPLITDVRTRPRTLPEDLRTLFYTYEETQRFRQEYRMERQLLAQLEEDPSSTSATEEESNSLPWQGRRARHRISRVVVRHHDTLETFYDDELTQTKATPTPSPFSLPSAEAETGKEGNFFDNDSFWSGSITWY